MKTEFYKLLEECHKDRLRDEYYDKFNIDKIAKLEYAQFCIWCRIFKNYQYTEHNFKEYVKTEKELSFWVKKKIAEMFFGYVYEFDYDTKKWHCKKLKTV